MYRSFSLPTAALKFPDDIDKWRGVLRVRRCMMENADGEWFVENRTKTYESTRDVDCPAWLIEKLLALPLDYKLVHPAKKDPPGTGDLFAGWLHIGSWV